MPALGMAQETGRLVAWLRHEGDTVRKGEPLVAVETDKSQVELEAPGDGVLSGVVVHDGEEVKVGTVMAWLLGEGEPLPASSEPASVPGGATPPSQPPEQAPRSSGSAGRSPGPPIRPAASPLARRMAAELDVAMRPGEGSGPGGAVLAQDVRRWADSLADSAQAPDTHRGVAERTTAVWTTTPHFYLTRDVRAGRLRSWLEAARRNVSDGLTYTDLILACLGRALHQHPEMARYWAPDGGPRRHHELRLSLAVDSEHGLLTVSLPDPTTLSLLELSQTRRAAVERGRVGRLAAADLEPAVLTLSNLGMLGVDSFHATLVGGQSAVLAVGRIQDRLLPVGGRPQVEPIMSSTLSCDHRVLDGAQGARFLATLTTLLEEPTLMLT